MRQTTDLMHVGEPQYLKRFIPWIVVSRTNDLLCFSPCTTLLWLLNNARQQLPSCWQQRSARRQHDTSVTFGNATRDNLLFGGYALTCTCSRVRKEMDNDPDRHLNESFLNFVHRHQTFLLQGRFPQKGTVRHCVTLKNQVSNALR